MAMLLSLIYDDICYVHLLSYLVEFLLEIPHLEQKAYPGSIEVTWDDKLLCVCELWPRLVAIVFDAVTRLVEGTGSLYIIF